MDLSRIRRRRIALAISTALVAFDAGAALAQTVSVTASQSASTLNTAILAAETAPSADIAITVSAPAVITGGTNVVLTPQAAGQGDGAISFANTGNLGVLTGSSVTDAVGIRLFGVNAVKAANTATVTNSGLVTGGIQAQNFGGAVSITNGGTVYGSLIGTGYGDVTITTTAAGKIIPGSVNYAAQAVSYTSGTAAAPVNGVTTTTYASGNVKIDQNGDALLADGTTPANLYAYTGVGSSTVNVGAKAGNVSSTGGTGNFATRVTANQAAPLATTGTLATTTYEDDYLMGSGSSTVAVASTGSVTGIQSYGAKGGSTVTVAGKVGTGQIVSNSSVTDYRYKDVETNDTVGLVSSVHTDSYDRVGGTAAITVAAGGSVGSAVTATGDAGAAITLNGNVTGNVLADQQTGQNHAYTSTYTAADQRAVEAESYTYAPGAATITVGPNVTIGTNSASASLTARSNGSAGITIGAGSIVNGNATINTAPGDNYSSTSSSAPGAPVTGDYANSSGYTYASAGGAATYSNAGYQKGAVTINAVTGATVANTGQITGATTVTTGGRTDQVASTSSQATAVATGTTTVTVKSTSSEKITGIAGDIAGTYSGTNGEASFAPVGAGPITQTASGNSTLVASGTAYGSLSSRAGFGGSNFQSDSVTTDVTVSDGATPANGSFSHNTTDTSSSTSYAGTSTVTVSGLVSNALGSVSVTSRGTTGAGLNVSGTVQGSATSRADGLSATASTTAFDNKSVTIAGVTSQTLNSTVSSSSTKLTGGAASASVTGAGLVAGPLNVTGVSSALAQIDAGATVSGLLAVNAGGSDTTGSSSDIATYDPATKAAVRTVKSASTSAAAAASGNATANVDGKVGSTVLASAGRGDATATVKGQVNGTVTANAFSTASASTSQTDYSGTTTAVRTKLTTTSGSTTVGGKAAVTVDTSAAFKAQGFGSTSASTGAVSASGLGGATVTVAAGSRVGGSASASSLFTDSAQTYTRTYNTAQTTGTDTTVTTYTPVGTTAAVVNNGTVDGAASATGLVSASVTNGGTAGSLSAFSLSGDAYTETVTDNDWGNLSPSTHKVITTRAGAPVGGAASVTNTGKTSGVSLAGATGTLTNSGTITGNVTLGQAVGSGTAVTTVTSVTTNSPTPVYTAPTTLFNQAYTVNQNGTLTGNIAVTGADWGAPDGKTYKTSNVAATINLNTGSTTTGTITGANNTTTVVNVAGGNLVLSGPAYVPASATVAVPTWSAGLAGGSTGGSFTLNVNAGTASVTPVTTGSKTFGLNGAVNVGASGTLVVGLLNTPANTGNAASVIATTPTVAGANLNVSGAFTSTGTVVVGLNGALVKTPTLVQTTTADFLAPITTSLNNSGMAYTTPAAAGAAVNSASAVTVGGALNLGGKLQVYVPTGSIFTGSESQTLFTVGGAITNTATVSSNLNSQFVTLSAATSGQTVVLKATRKSYATAAANPNAAAAAVGLDKAIPGVVKVLVDDASGIRGYSSLDQLSRIQDVANVVSNLDWNLNAAQSAQVFNELASASIYGSLANLRQNVAFEGQLDQLVQRRADADGAIALWLTPVGNFAKFGGTESGAAKIDATSYGAAIGLDIGYGNGGAFGFGFGYARHNVDAQGAPVSVDADTYTLGAYWTQGFGPLAVNAKLAYGFSTFDAHRDLSLLSRKITGRFRGNEWDGSLGLSYTLETGAIEVVPYGELALRHWHTNGFTEQGGAGLGLKVEGAGKTVFSPTLGLRLAPVAAKQDGFALRPYGSLSYTFQGDAGTARNVAYLGDPAGNGFTLNGVNPKGYATLAAGLSTEVAGKVNISVGGTYAFGNNNNVAGLRSIIGIKF